MCRLLCTQFNVSLSMMKVWIQVLKIFACNLFLARFSNFLGNGNFLVKIFKIVQENKLVMCSIYLKILWKLWFELKKSYQKTLSPIKFYFRVMFNDLFSTFFERSIWYEIRLKIIFLSTFKHYPIDANSGSLYIMHLLNPFHSKKHLIYIRTTFRHFKNVLISFFVVNAFNVCSLVDLSCCFIFVVVVFMQNNMAFKR